MALAGNASRNELLLIEEADAWFEYPEATRGQTQTRYAEIEPWAWARLHSGLRAIRARRARLAARRSKPAGSSARRRTALLLIRLRERPMPRLFTHNLQRARPLRTPRCLAVRALLSKEIHLPLPWFRRKKKTDAGAGAARGRRLQHHDREAPSRRRRRPPRRPPTDNQQPRSEAPPRQPRRTRPQEAGRRAAASRRDAPPASRSRAERAAAEPAQAARQRRRAKPPSASASARQRPRAPPPAARRAPLPKAKRELLVSVDVGEKRVAVLEDDRVAEVYLERPEHRSIAGNIYIGIVDNVLPGMEAAFVEIGLEKNGFLYVDEIVGPELEGRSAHGKIQDLIQRGQTVLVQAVKDPMKTKGARLTTEISLPGRFVVYVPHGEGLGVSRRLEDDERDRLKDDPQGARARRGRRDRPHRRRGRLRRGRRARPRLPGAALEDDPGAGEDARRRRAHLPGGRAAAARHARPLHRRLRAALVDHDRTLQADRRLPEEDLAAHGRARHALPGERAAVRGLRRRAPRSARRSAAASTCPRAAT